MGVLVGVMVVEKILIKLLRVLFNILLNFELIEFFFEIELLIFCVLINLFVIGVLVFDLLIFFDIINLFVMEVMVLDLLIFFVIINLFVIEVLFFVSDFVLFLIIFWGELGSKSLVEVFWKLEVLGNFFVEFNCVIILENGEIDVVLKCLIKNDFFEVDFWREFFVVVMRYLFEVFELFVWLFWLLFVLNKYFLEFLMFCWGFFICCIGGENFLSVGIKFIVLGFGELVVIICFILKGKF